MPFTRIPFPLVTARQRVNWATAAFIEAQIGSALTLAHPSPWKLTIERPALDQRQERRVTGRRGGS